MPAWKDPAIPGSKECACFPAALPHFILPFSPSFRIKFFLLGISTSSPLETGKNKEGERGTKPRFKEVKGVSCWAAVKRSLVFESLPKKS